MPQNPIGVSTFRAHGSWTDRSGTINTAGASQIVAAANPARKALYIENPTTATEPLYVNFTAAASDSTSGTNSSISLAPGGSYVDPPGFVTTEAVYVTAATAGHQFVCKEA